MTPNMPFQIAFLVKALWAEMALEGAFTRVTLEVTDETHLLLEPA